MKIILSCIAALTFSSSASAQEPLAFKGFQIGAEKTAVMAAFPPPQFPGCPGYCFWFPMKACRLAEPTCKNAMYYGSVLPSYIAVTFKEEKLVAAQVTFAAGDFEEVLASMRERFGTPREDEASTVQNRAGASFDNRQVTWARDGALLLLTKRAGNVDEAQMTLQGVEYLKQQSEERAQRIKEGAKGL